MDTIYIVVVDNEIKVAFRDEGKAEHYRDHMEEVTGGLEECEILEIDLY